MWEWAIKNVVQDRKEREKLLFSVFDALTWWLQPEIKQKQSRQKENTQVWPEAQKFIDELREHGASEEYVKKELARLQAEREQGDLETAEVIRGPNG